MPRPKTGTELPARGPSGTTGGGRGGTTGLTVAGGAAVGAVGVRRRCHRARRWFIVPVECGFARALCRSCRREEVDLQRQGKPHGSNELTAIVAARRECVIACPFPVVIAPFDAPCDRRLPRRDENQHPITRAAERKGSYPRRRATMFLNSAASGHLARPSYSRLTL